MSSFIKKIVKRKSINLEKLMQLFLTKVLATVIVTDPLTAFIFIFLLFIKIIENKKF